MIEDRGGIKIHYTLAQRKEDALISKTVHIFPNSLWASYLVLISTLVVIAFLSALFFSIFFPLFLFGGAVFGLWIWWVFRKLRKTKRAESLEGECVVIIKEAHIVEAESDKQKDQ